MFLCLNKDYISSLEMIEEKAVPCQSGCFCSDVRKREENRGNIVECMPQSPILLAAEQKKPSGKLLGI